LLDDFIAGAGRGEHHMPFAAEAAFAQLGIDARVLTPHHAGKPVLKQFLLLNTLPFKIYLE